MKLLGLDENRIRVITPDVGGGFGAKFILYPEEVAISAASRMLERPVKWIEDRREHFMASIQERDQYWDVEIGYDDDGRLLGAHGEMISDAGAYTYQGINLAYNASTNFPGPYVLPHYKLHVSVVETNKTPTAPVRGAGYPEGCFAMERAIDAIARERGIDRATIRHRNLVPANAIPYETPMAARSTSAIVYESGDFPACLDLALTSADYKGFPARREKARAEGRLLGFGIATGLKGTGRGPFESAIVRVGRSGKVSVYTGAMAMGQGLKTILAQITADQLGVAPGDITVVSGDTSTIQLGLGGFASRQTVTAGNSTHLAAKAVREKAIAAAALMLDVAPENLDIRDGIISETGKNLAISLRELADSLAGAPGYKMPSGLPPGLDAAVNFETSALTYGLGAHAVELEVDPLTGGVTLLNYVVVNDCGRIINPMTAEGANPRRRGARHRQRAVRVDGLRQQRAAADRDARGVSLAGRARDSADRRAAGGISEHQEPAWREGHRRIRHGPGRACDHLRHRGCAAGIRRADRRDADRAGEDRGVDRKGASRQGQRLSRPWVRPCWSRSGPDALNSKYYVVRISLNADIVPISC